MELNLTTLKSFKEGVGGLPKIHIADFELVTSRIDYFRALFLTDGGRPHTSCKHQQKELQKLHSNPQLCGINLYKLPEEFRTGHAEIVLWHETRYCPGRSGCSPNPNASNIKHRACVAIYKLIIYNSQPEDFHVEIMGYHGPGYTVDLIVLSVANEVLINNT